MHFVRKLTKQEKHWLDSFYKTHFAEMHLKSQNGMGIYANETEVAESLKEWLEEIYPTKKEKQTSKKDPSKENEHHGSRTPEHETMLETH